MEKPNPTITAIMVHKAKAMLEASQKLAAEHLAEGKAADAAKLYEAFGTLPVKSLARLYDIIVNNK